MADRMTPERERRIREMRQDYRRSDIDLDDAVDDLLDEVDRLRGALREACDHVAKSAVTRERDDAPAAALREAAHAVTADLERQGGDATGQYAVGMKRAAFLVRRRADEIGGA